MSAPGELRGPAETAAQVVAAINDRDRAALVALLADGAEVATGRSVHSGPDAIAVWAAKEYDHLRRVYAIDEYRTRAGRVLALGSVQYVWTEGGEVADSTPIALLIEIEDGVLSHLSVHDDAATALAQFDAEAAG